MNCTRRLMTTTVVALLTLSVPAGGAQAADGGNSENTKLCQKNGWMGLVSSTGAPFASDGECVAYAAKGGALSPKPAASLLFELGTCFLNQGGTYTCPAATLVGSGLMPGDLVYFCVRFANPTTRDEFCFPAVTVEADGTLPDELAVYEEHCTPGDVLTFIAVTAEGTSIRSSDICEP